MASLVPVAETAATPGIARVVDGARVRSAPAVDAAGQTLGRARSGHLHAGVLIGLADLATVVSVAALVDLTGSRVTPLAVLGLAALWVALLLAFGTYDLDAHPGGRARTPAVLRAGAVLGLWCWVLPVVIDIAVPPTRLMAVTTALTSLAITHRLTAAAWSDRAGRASRGTPVLIAGEPDAVARAVTELRRVPGRPWDVVSACVTTPSDDLALDVPISLGVDDLAVAAASAGAEAVLLLPCRELDPPRLRRLGWQLDTTRTRLYVGTGLLDVGPGRTTVVSAGDLSLIRVHEASSRGPARAAKELLERSAAVLLLLVLLPVLTVIAIAVRRDSTGPAIFRQTRIGRDGREFTMYKFRTMTVDAEDRVADLADRNESEGALLFKIRQDPRITRLGGLLRRYSIDELPQLLNVVLGDMALVGPRPALPAEVARYDLDPCRRLAVKPGITGLWQVSGRSDLSWEDTVRLDLHYVDNWSPGLDVSIMRRTLRAVLGHGGAY